MIVSISLPDELVADMDRLIKDRGYKGRSELLRAAMRDFLKTNHQEEDARGQVNAIIVAGYPEKLERSLSDVRHAHNDLVTSMLHAHTSNGRCATVLLGQGPDHKMRRLFAELRGLRELDFLDVKLV